MERVEKRSGISLIKVPAGGLDPVDFERDLMFGQWHELRPIRSVGFFRLLPLGGDVEKQK